MLKYGDFMNKTRSPSSESWPDEFEDPPISLFPDTPASNSDHFRETWAQERSLGIGQCSKSIPRDPRNVKIIPNSCTEIAVKE
jgi:hypothetical protein